MQLCYSDTLHTQTAHIGRSKTLIRDKYALGDHRTKPESVQLWQTHANAAMTIISSIRGCLGATINFRSKESLDEGQKRSNDRQGRDEMQTHE